VDNDNVDEPGSIDNVIDIGDVLDSEAEEFSFTWNWGGSDVLESFDPSTDVVNLKSFWTTPESVALYNDADGNAVIDLSSVNNQTITLSDVTVEELGNDNIIF